MKKRTDFKGIVEKRGETLYASSHLMPHISHKFFVFLALLIGLVLLKDAWDFFKEYQYYSRTAARPPEIKKKVVSSEAIVVLTGDKRRIPKAVELLRSRKSPKLLISGVYKGVTLSDIINAQEGSSTNAQQIWKHILLESKSTSTIGNAKESAKVLKKNQIDRAILVTSDFHMMRSLILFKRIAPWVEYIPYPVVYEIDGVESRGRVFLEYWKYVLLKYYFYFMLQPLSK